MVKKVRIRVCLQAQELSPEAVLANYLNSKRTLYPLKDMVMIALKSYWLPWAYRSNSLIQQSELDSRVRDCIHRLQLQIQELQQMLITEQVESASCSTKCSSLSISTKPEVILNTSVVKKFQIRFQVQVEAGSPEVILLDYLNSRQAPYPFEDMVITALKSFWLPLAHHQSQSLVKPRGDKIIQECIARLQLHANYLHSMLATQVVENDLTLNTAQLTRVIPESERLKESDVISKPESSLSSDVISEPDVICESDVLEKESMSESETEEVWDPYEKS